MTNQYSYAQEFASKASEATPVSANNKNISSAAKVYMMSRMQKENAASNYRSGSNNGQKYMTSEDFVTYFRSRQGIAHSVSDAQNEKNAKPMSSVKDNKPGEILRSASGTMPTRESVQRGKYPRPNVSAAVKINREDTQIHQPGNARIDYSKPAVNGKRRSSFDTAVFAKVKPSKLSQVKAVADEWMPEEKIVTAKKPKKERSFKGMFLGMAGVAISLMLIVSGSVMLSDASRDVKRLEKEAKELREKEIVLQMELDMKNDINVLREKATADLGMIGKEYVEAKYLNINGSDSIKVHEADSAKKEIGFSTILSAFGIN